MEDEADLNAETIDLPETRLLPIVTLGRGEFFLNDPTCLPTFLSLRVDGQGLSLVSPQVVAPPL